MVYKLTVITFLLGDIVQTCKSSISSTLQHLLSSASNLCKSMSIGVPSMRMLSEILSGSIVVNTTNNANIIVHSGSKMVKSELNQSCPIQIINDARNTPKDWIKSPKMCSYAARKFRFWFISSISPYMSIVFLIGEMPFTILPSSWLWPSSLELFFSMLSFLLINLWSKWCPCSCALWLLLCPWLCPCSWLWPCSL